MPRRDFRQFIDGKGKKVEKLKSQRPPSSHRYEMPYGMFESEIRDVPVREVVTVDLLLPEGAVPTIYHKVEPNSADVTDVLFDGTTGAVISDGKISVHFTPPLPRKLLPGYPGFCPAEWYTPHAWPPGHSIQPEPTDPTSPYQTTAIWTSMHLDRSPPALLPPSNILPRNLGAV